MNSERFVRGLAQGVFRHPALCNDFYRLWMDGPLKFPAVLILARNYLARTENTSTMVALSLLSARDTAAKAEIAKNLFSEFGSGNPEKAHLSLLRQFLCALLSRLRGSPFSLAEFDSAPLLPATQGFIRKQRELYTRHDQASVLGTLLAQEWLAYSMLTRLYEGARNYKFLFETDDEFHEHCEYFYVHIGDAEKDHKEQAIRAATLACIDAQAREGLRDGFTAFLDITASYWSGIHEAIAVKHARAA